MDLLVMMEHASVCAELWEVKWGLANEWPMGYCDLMLEPKGGLKVID